MRTIKACPKFGIQTFSRLPLGERPGMRAYGRVNLTINPSPNGEGNLFARVSGQLK